jgi:FkbM family methyltransferase
MIRSLQKRSQSLETAQKSVISIEEYERLLPQMTVTHESGSATFFTPSSMTAWRAQSLFTKEPDTIEWIRGFQPGETLLDVGANVGMYSIWAAKTRGVRVFAFEPEAQNYAVLNRNIYLNKLSDLISAYCVALSDRSGFDKLYLSTYAIGMSCHNFGEPVDFKYEQFNSPFLQGSFATTVDQIVEQGVMPVPQHIKIDVDGIEPKVIGGSRSTLANAGVKSVLIEINTNLDDHWQIVDQMVELGFDYSQEQVERAQRKEGTFKGVGNYVFRR